jgi:hypothetical protein
LLSARCEGKLKKKKNFPEISIFFFYSLCISIIKKVNIWTEKNIYVTCICVAFCVFFNIFMLITICVLFYNFSFECIHHSFFIRTHNIWFYPHIHHIHTIPLPFLPPISISFDEIEPKLKIKFMIIMIVSKFMYFQSNFFMFALFFSFFYSLTLICILQHSWNEMNKEKFFY